MTPFNMMEQWFSSELLILSPDTLQRKQLLGSTMSFSHHPETRTTVEGWTRDQDHSGGLDQRSTFRISSL